ncbi:MAG TPA: hypothetical protein VLL97_07870 [Acidobacteriota bacterium]|nr:hypothetical protein [Acidobacteriota bacterium]
MSIGKRSVVMVALVVLAGLVYFGARTYAPVLITYVVGQSLLQKSPVQMSPGDINERFTAYVNALHDHETRMQRLLWISNYLAKVQRLTAYEFEMLLSAEASDTPADG